MLLLLTIILFSINAYAQQSNKENLLYNSEKIPLEFQYFLNEYPKTPNKKELAEKYSYEFKEGKINLEIVLEKGTSIPDQFAESLSKRKGVPVYEGYIAVKDVNDLINTQNILKVNPVLFIPEVTPTPIEIKFDRVLSNLSKLNEEKQIKRIKEIGLKYEKGLIFYKVYSENPINVSNYSAIFFKQDENKGDYYSYSASSKISDMFDLAQNNSIVYIGPVYIEPIINKTKRVIIPKNLPEKEEITKEKKPKIIPKTKEKVQGTTLVESMITLLIGIIGITLVFLFFLKKYK